jgi:branched-chain amino acid aminotransferase
LERIVYYNGNLLPEDKIVISPFNRGLLYGDGVFETLRAYSGHIFRLEQHLERLFAGLQVLRIKPRWGTGEIEHAVHEVLTVNSLSDASLRITVSRGDGEGTEPRSDICPSLLITARQFDAYQQQDYTSGIGAHLVSIRRNSYSPLSWIKSLNYLDNILGRLEARDNRAREALFLNTHGYVAEGAASNIFMVAGGKLLTPPVDAGILPGITRGVVLEIANDINHAKAEQMFSLDDLLGADEAFLTNSLMELIPLVYVNNTPIFYQLGAL